jgi:hypothetical protein
MCESKCKQLFAECRNFNYTRPAKHTLVAYEKYHCCLKSKRWFSFCICITCLFCSAYVRGKYSAQLSSCDFFLPHLSLPLCFSNCMQPTVSVSCSLVSYCFLVFYCLWYCPWTALWNQSINVKVLMKQRKVMTLDEKIKILDKLHSGMSTAAVGLTFL